MTSEEASRQQKHHSRIDIAHIEQGLSHSKLNDECSKPEEGERLTVRRQPRGIRRTNKSFISYGFPFKSLNE